MFLGQTDRGDRNTRVKALVLRGIGRCEIGTAPVLRRVGDLEVHPSRQDAAWALLSPAARGAAALLRVQIAYMAAGMPWR
ncbi:hypothetical protein D8B24_19130 [Verminephrobacter aporrectodeae subsp. tuberculatae]|uniref:hypothetical protein n=1 Tax=Verminephrobacter aporrectodeae TaxID=1110389 RepID=UPI0022446185|nr:hypothetical protein [Verminephrobacter aporrectodeae]MCW8209081.1 hypothetical protein [Verminephrobacter aporrectodeae subsp. tuberculatae]